LSTIGRGMIVSHIKKLIKKNNDMVHQKWIRYNMYHLMICFLIRYNWLSTINTWRVLNIICLIFLEQDNNTINVWRQTYNAIRANVEYVFINFKISLLVDVRIDNFQKKIMKNVINVRIDKITRPRTIKTASFTIRKRIVNVFKTGHLRQYTVYIRTFFGPYHTVLSGAEIRAVFGRFLQLYGYNTVSRLVT
jgi:hypothetical protein